MFQHIMLALRGLIFSTSMIGVLSLPSACKSQSQSEPGAELNAGAQFSTKMELPGTHEKIDTHSYRMDAEALRDARQAMRAEAGGWSSGGMDKIVPMQEIMHIDASEAYAIFSYTSDLFEQFGALFAGGDQPINQEILILFKAAISGLNAMPKFQGPVFFGGVWREEDIRARLVKGEMILNRNFTSTSQSRKEAMEFTKRSPSQWGMGVLFEIENSCFGRDIARYSRHENEREVLFPPQHPFRIKEVKAPQAEGDVYTVSLEEILPCQGPFQAPESTEFPYCQLKKGVNAKLYADQGGTQLVGALQEGRDFYAYAEMGGYYLTYTPQTIAVESQACLDPGCVKKKVVLAANTPPLTLGEVTGVKVNSYFTEETWGVLKEGVEVYGRGRSEGPLHPDATVLIKGYVAKADVLKCSYYRTEL